MQVRVGYTQPKTYTLTPRRKRLGKAVARKCQLGIATETMKNPITRKKILLLVGREVQKEVRNMTADSTHSILGREAWKEFEWDTLLEELQINAPVLLSILQAATRTRAPRSNTKSVIGTRAAILLKHRSPKMSLLQKVISLVLYSGHTSNQVIYECIIYLYRNILLTYTHVLGVQRLQKLYQLLRLVDKLGAHHDAQVVEWCDALKRTLGSYVWTSLC